MKLRVTFKDPDQVGESVEVATNKLIRKIMSEHGLTYVGAEAEARERMKAFDKMIDEYFEYGEYLTVEMDAETQSIRVVSRKETD